ncbi:MAG: glucose/mannose-6-phosphate isomerase [Thermoleophilaceae bacterium]|nr:glucose/mannose-6-phosphate isomerase [Thermoleophilaceae bacterium]
MSGLTREAVAAVDPAGMLGDVLAQPHQIGDALWRVESAAIKRSDMAGGLAVAGMGGSAIGAELAAAALGRRALRPIRAVRDYALESWTHPETLVLCASYSGETEETLALFEDATERGLPRVALTTGGRLAERARAEGVPVIGVPSGMQPRAAVVYMVVAALECAALCGAGPSLRAELEGAEALLRTLADEGGPDGPDDSHPKRLARELHGSVPVLYGAGAMVAVARRWKNQLNENSKLPAFWAELPEADHNEVCGWERAGDLARLHSVLLDDPDADERTRRRFEPTARIAQPASHVHPVGANPTERVLGAVLLGDLVSVYLAALDGVDPSAIAAIEQLKSELAEP